MVRRLLLLNGLATLGVAIHHAAAYGLLAMFQWTHAYRNVTVPNYDAMGSVAYYALIITRQLDSFAIPSFLFVSGFFVAFAAGKSGKMKWDAVKSRIIKFLGPFVLWTALFFMMQRLIPRDVNTLLKTYYYIPLVMQYYLLAPYLGPWAKKHWKSALVVTAVIQIAVMSLSYFNVFRISFPGMQLMITLTPTWFFPSRIFYFTLGLVAGFHRKMFGKWFERRKYVLLGALVLFVIGSFVEYQVVDNAIGDRWLGPNFIGVFRTLYATTFGLVFLAFDKVKLPFEKQLNKLGSMSLGVYLANTPAIYVVSSLMFHLTPWVLGVQILYMPILIIAGVGIPVVMMNLLSKSPVKSYYQYVFG
ncbi:MAG: acyltransferase [Chloroflexi bacterium]|nr:acyltransferase [Chloroflexota bacterium]